MDETEYRESRICRLLKNPVVYQIVVLLDRGGVMTPSKLAKAAGRSVQTVSGPYMSWSPTTPMRRRTLSSQFMSLIRPSETQISKGKKRHEVRCLQKG
jgi:hypothetical protein